MPSLSVTIITRNEAEHLPATLASVTWADEVVVLDCGSTDGTVDIARAAGATVAVEPWRGYGSQKNRAAALARHDWIFSIDADERPDQRLIEAVRTIDERAPVYAVRRRNRLAGQPIRHWPWSWDRQRRLYHRRRTAFTEAMLHESVQVLDRQHVPTLPGVLEHDSYRDWDDFRHRQQRYAQLWAEQALQRGRHMSVIRGACDPALAFVRDYMLRGYVLGGRLGFSMACASARSAALRYAAWRRLAKSQ